MSKPIAQTEALCSMTKVTAIDCKVPKKHTRDVRESGALYLFIVIACLTKVKCNIFRKVRLFQGIKDINSHGTTKTKSYTPEG